MTKTFEEEYMSLAHALQSGIAYMQSSSNPEFRAIVEPKHLRVGVDLRAVENAALIGLLVEKGVFSVEEFQAALVAEMRKEVANTEAKIEKAIGAKVTLL